MSREIAYDPPKRKHIPWSRVTEILEKHRVRIEEEKRMLSWELRLEKRIRDAGYTCSAFDGTTTHDQRKEYFRGIIKHHDLAEKPCAANVSTTFAAAFETVYREKL